MDTGQYRPVACADYDVYEIAIMQLRNIDLRWTDQHAQTRHELIRPLELKIKQGAEYLLFELLNIDSNATQENYTVRLDLIQSAVIVDTKTIKP